MLFTILISAAQLAAGAAGNTVPSDRKHQASSDALPAKCLDTRFRQADETSQAGLRKLTELPPGDLHLSVVRRVGNCQVPTAVAFGFGGAKRNGRPLQ